MVTEIMGTNLRTREAILMGENELRSFHEIIEASYAERLDTASSNPCCGSSGKARSRKKPRCSTA